MGGIREAGEERTGGGIPKVAESRKHRGKLCNITQYFRNRKIIIIK